MHRGEALLTMCFEIGMCVNGCLNHVGVVFRRSPHQRCLVLHGLPCLDRGAVLEQPSNGIDTRALCASHQWDRLRSPRLDSHPTSEVAARTHHCRWCTPGPSRSSAVSRSFECAARRRRSSGRAVVQPGVHIRVLARKRPKRLEVMVASAAPTTISSVNSTVLATRSCSCRSARNYMRFVRSMER
jgi:hypothetical protein